MTKMMLYKNESMEIEVNNYLGTLALGTVIAISCCLIKNVFKPLVERKDLPDVIDKSKNLVNLNDFKTKRLKNYK
ncbi:hypothetical protein IIM_05140 [Bacillus cereus VD107]|nr:hypothetical protein IIM_05140 [Bacillus cereus VD107]